MRHHPTSLFAAIAFAVAASAGCATYNGMMAGAKLSGSNEVPPVSSMASGTSTITVDADKSVSGSIATSGIEGKAAHIHAGAAGTNGPVIVPLTKSGDASWSVPAGTKLTDAQYASYQSGGLYVNVHSAANPGGEIRAQLSGK